MPSCAPSAHTADFVVIGAGPAALACALWRARHGRVFVVRPEKASSQTDAAWIEAVPTRTIAELVALGIHPHDLGVREFVHTRAIAWRSPEPEIMDTYPAAHLERPALEHALLALAERHRRIDFVPHDALASWSQAGPTRAGSGTYIIDASGRRALTATRVHRPRRPWIARTFAVECDPRRGVAPLMVAALPNGYLYRAAGARSTTVGVVGRGSMLAGSGRDVCLRLLDSTARWAVVDLAARAWRSIGSRPASLQWAEFDNTVAIGDAAFARDALSSQGLACSLADARYAAHVANDHDRQALAERSRLACESHAAALLRMAREQWCNTGLWRYYQAELGALQAAVRGMPLRAADEAPRRHERSDLTFTSSIEARRQRRPLEPGTPVSSDRA